MSKVLRGHEAMNKQRWMPEPAFRMPVVEQPSLDPQGLLDEVRHLALTQADEVLAEAQDEAERLKRDAYAQGLAEGELAGRALSEHRYDEQIAQLEALVAEINQERDRVIAGAEDEVVRLSVTIAEKLLAQQLTLSPEIIIDLVRSHMKRLRDREVLRIRVNPDDLHILNEERHSLLLDVDGVREIHLYDDRRITRGSVVLEAESGSLDARLSSQLEIVSRELDETLEESHDREDD